jgi:hypothetical protein
MKSRWVATAFAAALLIFASGAAFAQSQERHEHKWDKDHPVFDDHEREVVRGWWSSHRDHPVEGFRDGDRLPRDWDSRLQAGLVLDSDWRHRLREVPVDLSADLPVPPEHFKYYVLGGHIVLVDQRNWHVADVIKINF